MERWRRLRDEIVAEVFAVDEPAWAELKRCSWDQLLPSIEQAVTQFDAIRELLCEKLFRFIAPLLDDWRDAASIFLKSDAKSSAPLLIGGVILLLQLQSYTEKLTASGKITVVRSKAKRSVWNLTPEQALEVRPLIQEAWEDCESVLRGFGIDTQELSFADLLDMNAFGGALFHHMLSDNVLLKALVSREPELRKVASPTEEALVQFRRFVSIGQWILDPKPLGRLAQQLREAEARVAWDDPQQRGEFIQAALYLDGMARLKVTRSARIKAYDDSSAGQSAILSLLRNPASMESLRAMTSEALDAYLVVDMTTQTPDVIWRLAREPPTEGLESRYSEAAYRFHEAAVPLEERSDGMNAFVGILAAIMAKPTDAVFIDEPEAFLHPPLIRNLARQLGTLARETKRQFFISTHSADLLESFVASGAEVNIIRLTHSRERSTARLLNSADVRDLARDPLLRSEATLSALFHIGAVVCEAAGDRVLYKEINERLLNSDDEALDSCVFLNAQNWNTIRRMVKPLRRMGVAAAAIVDADVLFETDLTLLLDAAQVDKVIRDGWLKQRDGLRDKLRSRLGSLPAVGDDSEEKKLQLKGKIIAGLKPTEKKIFDELRSSMSKYGVFIVPVGELEDWLSPLGLQPPTQKDKKPRWLQDALDRLGQDPQLDSYVRPAKGDIWDFMRSIIAWILDPERDGTAVAPLKGE